MQKTICDHCGKEVDRHYNYLRISKFSLYDSTSYQLCSDCTVELEEWINSKTQEKIQDLKITKEDIRYILYCIIGGIIGGIIPNIVKWLIF